MTNPAPRWHVPVRIDDVPDTGLHLDVEADADVRAGLAVLAGVRDIPRLGAAIDVVRQGEGLRASGRVFATVGQDCVVTLDPVENAVEETIDVVFVPPAAAEAAGDPQGEDSNRHDDGDEPPETLLDGTADLGGILADFLLLGIDRYPRKPGAVFVPPVEAGAADSPFAVLAKLKKPDN
jgi:uncharacterized metal-binding protein YceD (DUF177 family)